jgi:flagellum-specific peptidoglycan hydrolase FlgJ
MKGILLLCSLLFFFTAFISHYVHTENVPTDVQNYINNHLSIAIRECKMYNIPIAVKLAQGIHESNKGKSLLATKANNHFGIKWKGEGKYVVYSDDKPDDRFKYYSNVNESWEDHSDLLTKPRYNHLRNLSRLNYQSWAYGLKAAGYATDPQYAQKLIFIIEEYKLWKYDLNPLNW